MPRGRQVAIALAVGAAVAMLAWIASRGAAGGDVDATMPSTLSPAASTFLDARQGTVTVGWADFPPMAIADETGQVTGGYQVEAWDLAALKLGIEVEHVHVGELDEVVAALRAGEIDVAGGHGPRDDLTAFATPSVPFAWVPTVFVGPPALAGSAFDALSATTVPGSPLVAELAETHPELTYVPTETPVSGVAAVADGEVDLYFGPLALVGSILQQQETELVPIGDAVSLVELGSWTADPGAGAVVEAARAALTDDELRLLHVRWTGFDLTDPAAGEGAPAWLVPILLGALAAVLVFGGAALALRGQVRRATSELKDVNASLEQTVEQRTEQLTRSSKRLKRSNTALQRFTSTAAHDLKGPLTAISGLADVAIRMDLPEEQVEDLLGRVRDSARRLGRMVDDMLEDAVNMGADIEQLQGPDFAAWLREVTAPELDVIDGQLHIDVPDAPVDTDVEVLRRSALNLVGNAVKYAVNDQDGVVVRVDLSRDEDVWELRVDDNGPGIPKAMWSEVFDRGRRLTHDDRGFGLGLAAVRDLVQGAGGAIRVGDAQLGGASFVVTLPRTDRAQHATPPPPDAEAEVRDTARG